MKTPKPQTLGVYALGEQGVSGLRDLQAALKNSLHFSVRIRAVEVQACRFGGLGSVEFRFYFSQSTDLRV